MRRLRRILLVVLGLVVVALVAGYWWQRPLLLTGTGYAAHNACALDAIAGRHDPDSRPATQPPGAAPPHLDQHRRREQHHPRSPLEATCLGHGRLRLHPRRRPARPSPSPRR